jgi:hypothetical protein
MRRERNWRSQSPIAATGPRGDGERCAPLIDQAQVIYSGSRAELIAKTARAGEHTEAASL